MVELVLIGIVKSIRDFLADMFLYLVIKIGFGW